MKRPDIWFVGDPHGDLRFLLRALEHASVMPEAVILLGDLEAPADLVEWFEPYRARGIVVRYIHGNHDSDSDQLWRNLSGSHYWSWNLNGRVENVAGVNIAGLGGIFRGSVWCPPNQPAFGNYGSLEQTLVPSRMPEVRREKRQEYCAQQRLLHRSSIFPDMFDSLRRRRADVLVTHEAPSAHRHGYQAIDDLATALGVRRLFHGHHHERRVYPPVGDRLGFGVGMREIVGLDGEIINPQFEERGGS